MSVKKHKDNGNPIDYQSRSVLYGLFRHIMMFGVRCHYKRLYIHGKENMPKGGSYIMAPCHQQTVMDAFLMLKITPKSPVFLTRADIFSTKIIQKTRAFLRIMPVYRIRDGAGELKKNVEVFESCKDVLLHGIPLCMMAEGRHNNRHHLLPLGKGISRIACETQKLMGNQPLFIVPIGIDYDTYERPYGNVVVNIGKPIAVQPFMVSYEGNEAQIYNDIRERLAEAMKSLMLDISSEEHYEEIYTLCDVLNKREREKMGVRDSIWNRFLARQRIACRMDKMEGGDKFNALMGLIKRYSSLCAGLRLDSRIPAEHWGVFATVVSFLLCVASVFVTVSIPVIRMSALFWMLCYPITFVPTSLLFKRMQIDPQFKSSFNFIFRYVFSILYSIVIGIVLTKTNGLWMNGIVDIGGWWGLVSLALVVLGAALSGQVISWVRKVMENGFYWLLRLVKRNKMKALETLLDEMNVII